MAEPPHPSVPRLRSAAPALVLCAVALLLGWRVWAAPSQRLLGHVLSEHTSHLWVQWLLGRAARGEAAWLGQEGVLTVGQLWLMPNDPVLRVATALLQGLVGVVAATNLVIVGALALGACGVAALARQLGATGLPATLGGLVLLLHPAFLGYAADGRMDSLGVGWIALLGLAWLRGLRAPSWRRGLWLGLAAVLVVGAGPNHVVSAALVLGLPSLVAVWRRPAFLRVLLPGAMLAAVAAGLMGATLLHIESQQSSRLQETVTDESAQVGSVLVETSWEEVGRQRQADSWVATRELHQLVPLGSMWELPEEVAHHESLLGPLREQLVLQTYSPGAWTWPGLVPWLLAALGLWRRPRAVGPWALLAGGLYLLSFGWGSAQSLPLSVGGRIFYFAPATLLGALPGLSAFNNYGLFGALGAASLGVAVALGWTGARHGALVLGLGAVAWVAEVQRSPVPLPLPATELTPPAGLLKAVDALPEGGLLVLPVNRGVNTLLQVHHERPTPQRFWASPSASPREHPMLVDSGGHQWSLIEQLLPRTRVGHRMADGVLRSSGLGGVLLLDCLLPLQQRSTVRARLAMAMDVPPRWEEDCGVLYATSAAPEDSSR